MPLVRRGFSSHRKGTGLPAAANLRVKAIGNVFAWALENEVPGVSMNPARDVARFKGNSTGYHTWTPAEVEQYEQHHAVGSKARLALALFMYTGARRSDIVRLGKQHARNRWFRFKQHKNRNRHPVEVEIPILDELQAIIDASPTGDLTYLVTSHGRPYSIAGFGNKFREWCNEAGLPHCSAHGLRKAGATLRRRERCHRQSAHGDLRLVDDPGSTALHTERTSQEDGWRCNGAAAQGQKLNEMSHRCEWVSVQPVSTI